MAEHLFLWHNLTYYRGNMDNFIPFIHIPKKKEKLEQLPLYIELIPPEMEYQKDIPEEVENIIIIDII